MFAKKLLYGATLSAAALAAGFTGTSASAGGCYSGGYNVGYSSGYGDCGSYNYRTRDVRTSRRSTHHDHVTTVHHDVRRHGNHTHVEERVTEHVEPAGYYTTVYRAPVYRTYYDACGYPYRVQVRAGYHERVWVQGRRH